MLQAHLFKCHFLVPLWGRDYIRKFLELSLPSQLSPNNLPALNKEVDWTYCIYTRPEDVGTIESATIFKLLAGLAKTRVFGLQHVDFSSEDHYLPFSDCYREGMMRAGREGAASFFLTADQLWADGSINHVIELGRKGAEAVLGTGPRLIEEKFIPAFSTVHAPDAGGAITFTAKEGVRWSLDYLHPWDRSLFWGDDSRGRRASFLYWGVDGQGFIMHCFHLHPVLLNPKRNAKDFRHTIDGGDLVAKACPEISSLQIICDSDDAMFFSLAPARQSAQWINESKVDWLGLAKWALTTGMTKHNLHYLGKTIVFHCGDTSSPQWGQAKDKAKEVVDRLLDYMDHPIRMWFYKVWGRIRRRIGSFVRQHPPMQKLISVLR